MYSGCAPLPASPHVEPELGRQHDSMPLAAQRPAEHGFRAALPAVHVGGVEEGDARVQGPAHHRVGRFLIQPLPEVVAAQSHQRNLQPRPSQFTVFHVCSLALCRLARVCGEPMRLHGGRLHGGRLHGNEEADPRGADRPRTCLLTRRTSGVSGRSPSAAASRRCRAAGPRVPFWASLLGVTGRRVLAGVLAVNQQRHRMPAVAHQLAGRAVVAHHRDHVGLQGQQ